MDTEESIFAGQNSEGHSQREDWMLQSDLG